MRACYVGSARKEKYTATQRQRGSDNVAEAYSKLNPGKKITDGQLQAASLIARCRGSIDWRYAHPPLPWPVREAGPTFNRLWSQIRAFLLNLGPDFAWLLQNFDTLVPSRRVVETVFASAEDRSEVAEEYAFDEIQVDAVLRAIQLLVTASRHLAASEPTPCKLAASEKSEPASTTKGGGRRGPKPRDHQSVAEVACRYEKHWRDHLDEICEALDEAKVPTPRQWRSWASRPTEWLAAAAKHRKNVIKTIEHSLQMARPSVVPETLGNIRK